jgi:hypothetical protein
MKQRRLPRAEGGQIVLPALAALVILGALFSRFMLWGKRTLWQMRVNNAAEAAALSAARSQAEMLNTIAVTNLGVNQFITKARIPWTRQQVGAMPVEKVPAYTAWNRGLKSLVFGFKTFPAGVGETVARLNGAEGYSLYRPLPMAHHLLPISMPVAIVSKSPPWLWIKQFKGVYYARDWSPRYVKAQPPHTTTWLVSRQGLQGMAKARLWLDVRPRDFLNNGGFPRASENWMRDVLIQGFYPQFNARLVTAP